MTKGYSLGKRKLKSGMMDVIPIGSEVQVKRPHGKPGQSLESTGVLGGISCVKWKLLIFQ